MPSSLDTALARIDELVQALTDGTLTGGCKPQQAPAAAVSPLPLTIPAPAVAKQSKKEKNAAAKERTVAAEGGAFDKQSTKEKKTAVKERPAAAEGDAFDKAKLVVALVTSVSDHPSGSDKLWLCKIDVGGGQERQVVAGLKKHISREELKGRLVVCVLNLKPAKLAGELSEAMILAADHKTESGELVQVLSVPNSCLPGDSVHRDGSKPPAEFPKECKSKVWKEIVDGLAVQGGVATYLGAPLVTSSGRISVASDMPDGSSIH